MSVFKVDCQHCYCIDVPPSGHRTRKHVKCCKCGDIRLAWDSGSYPTRYQGVSNDGITPLSGDSCWHVKDYN